MSAAELQSDTPWQALAGTARGASHERSGSANQDCGRVSLIDNGTGVILAVADGHGDAMHARSERGSRFAVEAAFEILEPWMKVSAEQSQSAIQKSATRLPKAILDAWRRNVASD